MLSLFRTRTTVLAPRNVASLSTAFRPTGVAWKSGKEVDPTPDKARGGSEQSGPGASGDDIANSDGAYDSSKPRPDQSSKQIEKEKPVDMDQSAASQKPSDNAVKGQNRPISSSTGSRPGPSGGSAVRGGNSR